MNNKPYKRKPGDFEIRILNDGKVIMLAPDESLIEVAQAVDPVNTPAKMEIKENGRSRTNKTKKANTAWSN